MQCTPRVVGIRRTDAVPAGLTDRCPKCASGDSCLQRGVPGSDRAIAPCRTRPGAYGAGPVASWPRGLDSACVSIVAARPSWRCAWALEPHPRQALGVLAREATID